jgi:hypothetical protein
MEIVEAYDLTGSSRRAAALVGCDHETVAHWVAVREQTGGPPPARAKDRRPVPVPVPVWRIVATQQPTGIAGNQTGRLTGKSD